MGGTKKKIGKQRRDKAYWSAKEIGYRSRASFKLLQINRDFEFLQKSSKCLDLCAAPGSWMQVAKKHMRMNSIVIGVDLAPIKPLPGCLSIQGDITTEKTRSDIRKELHGAKVDLVLHDGAPNVGKDEKHDFYTQNLLTHHAFKLATEFLAPKGTFVTKVFRSKDYEKLHYVFNALFEKVVTKKPAASRMESAEIFLVCLRFKAPDKIDPRFLNYRDVFADVEETQDEIEKKVKLQKSKKAPAEGYDTSTGSLYKEIPATEFISSSKWEYNLETFYRIVIDADWINDHPKTTEDIRIHCDDLKVLGNKEKKELKRWREKLKSDIEAKKKKEEGDTEEQPVEKDEEDEDEKELEGMYKQIQAMKEEERKTSKRSKKKSLKEKRKNAEKINLKMVIPGDEGPTMLEEGLFQIKNLKGLKSVNEIDDVDPDNLAESEASDQDEPKPKKKKVQKYQKENGKIDQAGLYYKSSESESEESDEESDHEVGGLGFDVKSQKERKRKQYLTQESEEENEEANPLLVNLDDSSKEHKKKVKADLWFQRDVFKDLGQEEDDTSDEEDDKENDEVNNNDNSDKEDSDSDFDVEESYRNKKKEVVSEKKDFEIVSKQEKKKKNVILTPEELALAQEMIISKKRKRDIMERGWNRYMFNDRDEDLPDWFVKEEEQHMRPRLELDPEVVEKYRQQQRDLNVRTIKKVAEAKARKKKRLARKMDKAKKKAASLLENPDLGSRQKASEINKLYKKAKASQKKEVAYVVAKKATAGKRAKRPSNVKGPYKQVDPRMKKDNMNKRMKATDKKNQKRRMKGKKAKMGRS